MSRAECWGLYDFADGTWLCDDGEYRVGGTAKIRRHNFRSYGHAAQGRALDSTLKPRRFWRVAKPLAVEKSLADFARASWRVSPTFESLVRDVIAEHERRKGKR